MSTPEPNRHSPLYMISMPVDLAKTMRAAKATSNGSTSSSDEDSGLLLHHCLSALFGKGTLQPFLLEAKRPVHTPTVLAYSSLTADELRDKAALNADPLMHSAIAWENFACKPMPTKFTKGTRLGFKIRFCPVSRLASDRTMPTDSGGTTFKRGSEIDAWLHQRIFTQPTDSASTLSRDQAYSRWLSLRLQDAAQLETFKMTSFRRIHLARRNHLKKRSTKRLERPDVFAEGILKVSDPDALLQLLARGLGRHRAFGFGMLLLRNPT